MIAASVPRQRPPQARMLVLNAEREIQHHARSKFTALLRPDDLVVANDAATLPASLSGTHEPTGRAVEVRLAGRESLRVTTSSASRLWCLALETFEPAPKTGRGLPVCMQGTDWS